MGSGHPDADLLRWLVVTLAAPALGLVVVLGVWAARTRHWSEVLRSCSYGLFLIFSVLTVHSRLGTALSWRTPFLFVAIALGLAGFALSVRERKRWPRG